MEVGSSTPGKIGSRVPMQTKSLFSTHTLLHSVLITLSCILNSVDEFNWFPPPPPTKKRGTKNPTCLSIPDLVGTSFLLSRLLKSGV